jgi:parallel beta-helix repeat protein
MDSSSTNFSIGAALSRRTVLRIGMAAGAMFGASCCGAPANAAEASVAEFGARGDGAIDDTAAFQRACDRLTGGGVLRVPAGTYLLDRVDVRHRGISVQLAPGAMLRKRAPAGPDSRGIFVLDGLHDAGFELRGGTVDLNGEGPREIGRAGRIRNLYAALTIPTVVGIAGPANAAVFARRSSGITVADCTILNSGENGLLFRNCGRVTVRGCNFSNIANYAIEFSFVAPGGDGGSGPIPSRNDVVIEGCRFENIDDYALGSGNGGGIGGGGGPNLRGFRNYRISDCTFVRCHRDIHFEFQEGSWIEQLEIARITSIEPRQGSIGLVSVRDSVIRDVTVENPGSAPSALLIPARPELFGVVLSSGFSNILLSNVTVRDNRPGRLLAADGASIERGSTRLRTQANVFEPGDVDTWIGILRGNPQGAAYVGRIASVVGPREVELDLPAGATVRGGRIAIGGIARNGVILTAGSDVIFDNVELEVGAAADPASMGEAAAVRMWGMTGDVIFRRTVLRGPAAGNKPAGLRVTGGRARLVGLDTLQVQGFGRSLLRAE